MTAEWMPQVATTTAKRPTVGVVNVSADINKSIHVHSPLARQEESKQRERPSTPPDRLQGSAKTAAQSPMAGRCSK
jgi:hypothetical protein